MVSSPSSATSWSTPGSRDESTLRAISAVAGKQWVTVTSEGLTFNQGRGAGGRNSQEGQTQQTNQQLIDALDSGAIARGMIDKHPNYVLGLSPGGVSWSSRRPTTALRPGPICLFLRWNTPSAT